MRRLIAIQEKDDVIGRIAATPDATRVPPMAVFASAESLDFIPQAAIDKVCLELHCDPERFAREYLRLRRQVRDLAESVQGLLAREAV